ncbi:hypothetical protein EJF18_40041 [Clavispora lusitaniae]|uniref:Uncharacterized protein n=1 Tax=Clavispora lusitaniae TaxID=36911 RepID=A0ACD0WKD3_CLALS|nr:hypothetical protein EJF14_40041 [Clavispora lusitaniae]QFZ33683.1 hypothetical protein EJF16_40041 [Clavispora lusitaniae]QFZ39354.1 hypothetical protein EJF15_40041 [Clavispora lusitaniae]QFZ45036.1 hypothetical protein EJF18_40041 [Clavispora lusitaniae]QFZ50713.1 hypothetical protein EJF17_40041 [Clavispora lusitaniae]
MRKDATWECIGAALLLTFGSVLSVGGVLMVVGARCLCKHWPSLIKQQEKIKTAGKIQNKKQLIRPE